MAWYNRKKNIEERSDTITPDNSGVLQSLLNQDAMTKEKALNIPEIRACIKFIADTVSMIPIKLYSESNGEITEIKDDNRIRLLNDETGDTLDAAQFWKAIIEDYFLGKGGYAYIKKIGTKIESLHYVEESQVSVLKNSDPIFKEFKFQVNGKEYKDFEFIKLLRNTKDGASGTSIIKESSKILSVAYESLVFEEQLVKKGGNKKGFLLATKKLSQEIIDGLKATFKNLYSNNTESIAVLNDGLQFQESSNTSVEMQLNENKKTNSEQLCFLFLFPSSIAKGNYTDKEYNNAFKTTILPILRMIECALNKDFLLEREKKGEGALYYAFDTREVLKGDLKSRYEAYSIAIKEGFKKIDEIRYMENDKAFGIDWINLGLNSVLYDIKTKEIYTPNTGKQDSMQGGINEDIESLNKNGEVVTSADVVEATKETTGKILNGAQTQSLITVISQYQAGILTLSQAVNIISVAIGISREEATELIGEAK